MCTMKKTRFSSAFVAVSTFLLVNLYCEEIACAFSFATISAGYSTPKMPWSSLLMSDSNEDSESKPAGSFFHKVPPSDSDSSSLSGNDGDSGTENEAETTEATASNDSLDEEISQLLKQRRKKPLSSQPSTIDGVPTEKAMGFGKPKTGASSSKKSGENGSTSGKKRAKAKPITPYVAIGTPDQPINDPTKPERDDQGYTLYTDTQTGEKSRVFEALMDYPSIFTIKIVGANEGSFVSEMVALVAEACETDVTEVNHSTKVMGKWVSVTVKAPVQSAEMVYLLYEKVDQDPRVKFKF